MKLCDEHDVHNSQFPDDLEKAMKINLVEQYEILDSI